VCQTTQSLHVYSSTLHRVHAPRHTQRIEVQKYEGLLITSHYIVVTSYQSLVPRETLLWGLTTGSCCRGIYPHVDLERFKKLTRQSCRLYQYWRLIFEALFHLRYVRSSPQVQVRSPSSYCDTRLVLFRFSNSREGPTSARNSHPLTYSVKIRYCERHMQGSLRNYNQDLIIYGITSGILT
jgi:hypothetical protein